MARIHDGQNDGDFRIEVGIDDLFKMRTHIVAGIIRHDRMAVLEGSEQRVLPIAQERRRSAGFKTNLSRR